MLYVSHYLSETEVLGPGKRFALWLQGCKKKCPGCIYPEGQSLDRNGTYISVEDMLSIIAEKSPLLRGITISGGEPVLQYEALMKLLKGVRKRTSLDVMLYTGYTLSQVKEILGSSSEEFLGMLDILVDGEYYEEENHNEMLRGSANQQIYFFTEKYKPFSELIKNRHNRSIEWHSSPDGELWMSGIPPKGFQDRLHQEIIQKL